MKKTTHHPVQDIHLDKNGTVRFRENKIVKFLLGTSDFDLAALARRHFSRNDREQFAMLIGYSLDGFSELSFVRNKTWDRVEAKRELAKMAGRI